MHEPSLPVRRRSRLALALGCALGAQAFAETVSGSATAPEAYDRSETDTLDEVEVNAVVKGYAVDRSSTATRTDTPLRDVPHRYRHRRTDPRSGHAEHGRRGALHPGLRHGAGRRQPRRAGPARQRVDVRFLRDGLRDDVQYFRDFYNVERVEGLKGPNAMIFGRGGSGGLINRVTKQADWNDAGNVSVLFGSWGNRRTTADLDRAQRHRRVPRDRPLRETPARIATTPPSSAMASIRRSRCASATAGRSPSATNISRTNARPTAAFPRSAGDRWKPTRRPSSAIPT
ncbi:hypothetical protein [Tahibacter caeni]|uniref:hypothetical protein n=1 Tax=Tahibacter caeni TaxID=1453545 RepID=UPI002148A218|nr:hypothetical protein [Tahibacter caeni]